MSNSLNVERKLAAIMFTDIADYTAISAKDETKALELLNIQKKILAPIVKEFNGTLHKEMGDGNLLSFKTVSEAVKCGIKIQEETRSIENLNLRIGIHEGEVTLKNNDLLGDDVNIAARIEPFSAIGGIAISGKVQQNISSLTHFKTKYIGKPKLKGVSQEVNVYCITSHGLPETDISKVSAKLEVKTKLPLYALIGGICILITILFFIFRNQEDEVPSIAIIPLENKGEIKDEFYSYSISSDLISDVSSAGNIRVASLKDIEKLDYISLTNEELAKKLFVRYISQGSLWKVDSIFQLSLELYDTKKERIQWSKNWQKNWSDLPTIKGGLSENILTNLDVVTKLNTTKTKFQNPEAYEFYLKAKNIYEKRENIEDTKIAQQLLNKAIDLDENLLAAKVILGDSYRQMGDNDNAMVIYRSAVTKAEELDDKLWIGSGYRKIGIIHHSKGEYEKALDYFEKSLVIAEELEDKYGMAKTLNNFGNSHNYKGNLVKALDYFEKSLIIAEELGDKHGMANTFNNIGNSHNYKGKLVIALEFYEKSIAIQKELGDRLGIANSLFNIGINHYKKRELDIALDYYLRSLEIREEIGDKFSMTYNLNAIGLIYADKGQIDKALDFYNRTLTIRKNLGDIYGIGWALITIGKMYYEKGDLDTALDFYERSLVTTKKIGDKQAMLHNLDRIGSIHTIKGDYDTALDYLSESLKINQNFDDKNRILYNSYKTGVIYYYKGNYQNAVEYLKKSLNINKEIKLKELELYATTALYLCYNQIGKDYDLRYIRNLIQEINDIELEPNYMLYKLLKENSFLEAAYNQLQQKISIMDKEIGEKFISYPIEKEIIKYYNKEFSSNQ